jgi:AAA domain
MRTDEFVDADDLNGAHCKPNGHNRGAKRFGAIWFENIGDDDEESEWLVRGLIPTGGFVEIYGQPSCGKSFLALALGMASLAGVPFSVSTSLRLGLLRISARRAVEALPNASAPIANIRVSRTRTRHFSSSLFRSISARAATSRTSSRSSPNALRTADLVSP